MGVTCWAEWCQTVIPRDRFFNLHQTTIYPSTIYLHQTTMIRFFFFHSFWSPAFDLSAGVAINVSRSYTLTSAILKTVTSHWRQLPHDLLYNPYTDMLLFIFYLSHASDKVCKIRFVNTGENCGKPCLVCKKKPIQVYLRRPLRTSPSASMRVLPCSRVISLAISDWNMNG